jgi:class 3 adenylate cyclase/tetratricopeptide (TPR) repeat protein
VTCSNCGTDNREGRKFCSACGNPLAVVCGVCGAANEPEDRFCGECGSALDIASVGAPTAAGNGGSVAERRLVSVLFVDLVGFTTLSESRDPEEVRELLSRYFETARTVIDRYGGVVEKFIGDAVMAVWGAPVANEDDAERAVRAALDLVAAVSAMGEDVHAPKLAACAGVATGDAAVTLGAEGQGMVAGDLVNTASRIQSVAAPGTVLVMASTRHATESAIVYEDAGSHELKGKAEPIELSRAVRVIALVGGELRSVGLESPFVGRDREFRRLKDAYHDSAEDRLAHLVSITGIAGIGKSRLSWEFFKYIDGIRDTAWWHRGRCIPYGDGVTYWALAEMIRMRARILEDEEPESARDKLRAAVEEHVPDAEDRGFIEPRLAHLLGLEERVAPSREDLFAGARLFFERLTDVYPVVLVFEDLQWADEALLDFIEYLLEWSRSYPIFVVTLARPELLERRPTWGTGRHGTTTMSLEPLTGEAMEQLLRGMVPGLPQVLLERIRDRAEGIPLYAVETVRMLLDRGLLTAAGDRYEPVGDVNELAVPETLQALISARLDGLPPEERQLVQTASVLGKTFTASAVAELNGRNLTDVEPLLASLVRKELLNRQVDPRSPERGQYSFLQSLVQRVAYETLSKRDRRARHLAAADHLERTWSGDEDEIVEVVASHLQEAYELAPEAEDAPEVRARAQGMLARAGERARSLASLRLAMGYFERAADLTDDPLATAQLIDAAADCARNASTMDDAVALSERARSLYESIGDARGAARASAGIGEALWLGDRIDEGAERMEEALAVLADAEPDHDLALLLATLGKIHFFQGENDRALVRIDAALDIAEAQALPDVLSDAMNTKGLIAGVRGHHEEELALLKHSLDLALEHDAVQAALRAYSNLSYVSMSRDRFDDARLYQIDGLALANRIGYQGVASFLRAHLAYGQFVRGEWEPLAELVVETLQAQEKGRFYGGPEGWSLTAMRYLAARGDVDTAAELYERTAGDPELGDEQTKAFRWTTRAVLFGAQGEHAASLEAAQRALEHAEWLGRSHDVVKWAVEVGLSAAIALRDEPAAEAILRIPEKANPIEIGPYYRGTITKFSAALADLRGDDARADADSKTAIGLLRETGARFHLAVTLLEHGERLSRRGLADEARPLLEEAEGIFRPLEATPYLERVAAAAPDLARA